MEKYKTKVDIVYEALMEAIYRGDYVPGNRIVISKVAKDYNISETPVREAIRRMESEGYLEVTANQGAIVSHLLQGTNQIEQIFQIKGVLEGYAARLSIDYLTPEILANLHMQNDKMALALKQNNMQEYSNLNVNFHLTMYDCIPQKELVNMIRDLWQKWAITKAIFKLAPTRVQSSFKEHEKIIELAKEKKYDDLEFYVRQHKFNAGNEFVKSLDLKTTEPQ